MNIAQFYKKTIKENKYEKFLFDENFSITYHDFDCYVNNCVKYLNSISNKEFTVMSLLPNSIDQLIIFTASFLSGKNFCPLDCDSTYVEIQDVLKIIKPKLIFTSSLVGGFKKIKKKDFVIKKITVNKNLSWLKKTEKIFNQKKIGFLFIKTSGSIGKPKIIKIKISNLFKSSSNFLKFSNIPKKNYIFWNYLPMSYLGGLFNLFIIPFNLGGSIFVSKVINGFYLLNFFNVIKRYKINVLWLIPTIIRSLSTIYKNIKKFSNNEIKFAFLGTAPISLKEKTHFENKFNINLLESYGLSETTFISCEKYTDKLRFEGSVGKIIKNIKIKINKANREIYVKTPYLFEGYIHPDRFEKVNSNDYFKTKDLGSISKGLLKIIGREGSSIKKGGRLINLLEIENKIRDNCQVEDVAALAINDKIYGKNYNLYIVPKHNSNSGSINKCISNIISRSDMPNFIKFLKKIKKTTSGKVKLSG